MYLARNYVLVEKWKTSFNVHGSVHLKNIPIYIQQGATSHSLFYLEIALHVSGGTSTYHQERKQLYLQDLVFVRPLLLPAAIAAGSSNGLTSTRCCRYSCLRSWWWVEVPPETCRAVFRYNKLCNVASCWIYVGIRITSYKAEVYDVHSFIKQCEINWSLSSVETSERRVRGLDV